MKFSLKEYKKLKTKNYIKNNSILFFFSGINKNSSELIKTKQELKKMELDYYKIANKPTVKEMEKSIFSSIKYVAAGPTFLLKQSNDSKKSSITYRQLLSNFEPLLFNLIVIKLNNKIYSKEALKNVNSLSYKENFIVFNQFRITNLKSYFRF